jgi:hypothetical protein
MARYRGQKSLYEVIGGRARNKSAQPQTESLRPEPPKIVKPVVKKVPVVQTLPKERAVIPEKEVISWKPKPFQCHDGRIEVTLSTKGAVMAFLCVITVFLACFRTGQLYPGSQSGTLIDNSNNASAEGIGLPSLASARHKLPRGSEPVSRTPEKSIEATAYPEARPSSLLAPGNAIMIQEYHLVPDLVAAGRFFAAKGIPTEIVRKGSSYYLITQERFGYNPASAPDTSGYRLLEWIRILGQDYEAPKGLQSFAPNRFKGAYGRNIDDQYIGEATDVD